MYSPAFGHFGTPSYMGGDSNYEESDYTSDAPGDGIGVEGAYKMAAEGGDFQAMAPAGAMSPASVTQMMATRITETMPDWNLSQPMLFGGLALGGLAYMQGVKKAKGLGFDASSVALRKNAVAMKAIGALVGLVSAAYLIQDQTISSVEFGDLGGPALSAINAEIARLKSKKSTVGRKARLKILYKQRALLKKHKKNKQTGKKVPWGLKAAGALTIPFVGPAAAATIAARNLNRLRMERKGKAAGKILPPRPNYTGKVTKKVNGKKVTAWFWRGKRVSLLRYKKLTAQRVVKGGGSVVPTTAQAQAQQVAAMIDGTFQSYPTSGGEDTGIETSDDLDLDLDVDSAGGPNLMLIGGGIALAALGGFYLYTKKGKGKSKAKANPRRNRSRRNRSR